MDFVYPRGDMAVASVAPDVAQMPDVTQEANGEAARPDDAAQPATQPVAPAQQSAQEVADQQASVGSAPTFGQIAIAEADILQRLHGYLVSIKESLIAWAFGERNLLGDIDQTMTEIVPSPVDRTD